MLWQTLWALVLGFGFSGAMQSFVEKDEMRRALGDHRPATVVKAAGLGMVSSSCSYAASTMAKSLFAKGADFLTAMAFMVASTNLVVELGVVLVVLMGWQFAAAEWVGGPIMIAVLVLAGSVVLSRGGLVEAARSRLDPSPLGDPGRPTVPALRRWSVRLRSREGWRRAAGLGLADLTMLRTELVIGYLVAGVLAAAVPARVFADVFITGHGAWSSVENVIVGPVLACLSFVCSIGNVPMAAALYQGGISFGGAISFIFADLVALPLILVYRKFYGARLTLRLCLILWGAMAVAGLSVEGLAAVTGLEPSRRHGLVVAPHLRWDTTSVLDLLALAVLAVMWWEARHQDVETTTRDPICGMPVDPAAATHLSRDGHDYWFCSDGCQSAFLARR